MYTTVQILSKTPVSSDGRSTVVVRFAGGNKGEQQIDVPITVERSWTQERFVSAVRELAEQNTATESFLDGLAVNVTFNLTKAVDPNEAAQRTYRQKAAELRFIRQLIADGIVDASATSRASSLVTQMQNAGYGTVFP